MTFKVIRGQGQGQEMTLVPIRTILTEYVQLHPVFTTRRYASAVSATIVCLSVRHMPVLCKTAKSRTMKTTLRDIQGLQFSDAKILAKFEWGHPQRGCQMQVG